MKDEVALELETRRRIYNYILSNPGSHLREIQRSLDMPMGLLEYHLNYLQKREIITVKEERYYKRYFASKLSPAEKSIVSAIRQEKPRRIVLYLMLNPNSTHKEIMENFDLSPSTLSFYLKDLVEKGVVERVRKGRENEYSVLNKDEIVKVLITYRRSFLDQLVDRFLETWFEM